MSKFLRIVIVGGVAGGASAAARARRLSEDANIILVERGQHISFANCGLPYHIGGVISRRDALLVQTADGMAKRFRIDVRARTEAESIDPGAHTVRLRDLAHGQISDVSYDKLILSPGASPIRPALPGIDDPRVYTLRNMADMDAIKQAASPGGQAVVVGAGYIGLEMAENLRHRGLKVTIVEKQPQVFPLLDVEMASTVAAHLAANGVELVLKDGLAGFADATGRLAVRLESDRTVEADLAVLAAGVRPETGLAKSAGLAIGPTGGIAVNAHMQTSDPDIYAVGDAVEVRDAVTGQPTLVPLAGPANRQGRVAVNHIFAAGSDRYEATQGTGIVSVFGMTVAMTGASERTLKRFGIEYRKIYLHPTSHAGYYPGAEPMHLKLLFALDGKVLGAQITGGAGVDKRIDVLAVAVRHGLTVYDLEELELAYAPPFGSAKDPVNMAGFVAANLLRGLTDIIHFEQVEPDSLLLDVRTPEEFVASHLPGAINVPLDELRERVGELPRDRKINVYCGVGIRGYVADRILKQHGLKSANISGGLKTWSAARAFSRLEK